MASTLWVFAEGTKELRPTQNDQGSLHIGMMNDNYTSFGVYDATPENQIRISIADLSETIYFGMGGVGGRNARPYRILSPTGQIVYESTIPGAGFEGNIGTWQQAVNGPAELGVVGGYNAIELVPEEIGNYIIEFDDSNGDFTIPLFDVTVADANNEPILGRLHSLGWQIDTGSYSNAFGGVVYPYDPSGVVYEVDFNGMQPFLFVINFNSFGTGTTGNFLEDRQSKIGNYTSAEFEVFLNPPDPVLYPTFDRNVTFGGEVVKMDCMGTEYCLNFTSNVEGYLDGYIDIDANDVYSSDVDVYFNHHFTGNGTTCVPWDGRDPAGNPVNRDDIKVIASFGFGVTHLPIFDAEHNRGGYIVNIIKPENLAQPTIQWDDSQITQGRALDNKVNIFGCLPTAYTGCHRWEQRGDINGGNQPGRPTSPETINTWWYAKVLYDTLLLSTIENPAVQLSFHPDNLNQQDTVVCEGSMVPVYIYNDGLNHYDVTKYSYEWFLNNAGPVAQNVREINDAVYGITEVVIKATDLGNNACATYDTLHISTVPPITVQADISTPGCGENLGYVSVNVLTGPPNPVFTWAQFPSNTSNQITGLSPGTYSLHIEDSDFDAACALDTVFSLSPPFEIAIEDITSDSSLCYRQDGTSEVFMQDPSRQYEYSWDNQNSTSQSSISGLAPGEHDVIVTDMETGCTDDTIFTIVPLPFTISMEIEEVQCSQPTGRIQLTIPSGDFDISWNGVADNQLIKENLQMGIYSIAVVGSPDPICRVDTVAEIGGTTAIAIEEITTDSSLCYENTGAAGVVMEDPTRTYEYSWNSQPATAQSTISSLAPGNYTISVTEPLTGCTDDSVFIINQLPLNISAETEDAPCNTSTGRIEVFHPAGSFTVYLDGTSGAAVWENLSAGTYQVEVVANSNATCRDDTTVNIEGSESLEIEEITTEPSLCYENTGQAAVFMANSSGNYEYTWDGQTAVTLSSVSGLAPGNHTILVTDPLTGCTDDSIFVIDILPLTISATKHDIACLNPAGMIEVFAPASNLTVTWNGVVDNVTMKNDLFEGSYSIHVQAGTNPACAADTLIEITKAVGIAISDYITAPSLCYEYTGKASVSMQDPTREYVYSWNNQPSIPDSSISGLAPGMQTVLVTEPSTGCTDDTTMIVGQIPLTYSATTEDIVCSQPLGKIKLDLPEANFNITWNGQLDNVTEKDSLGEGTYSISVVSPFNGACRFDTIVNINNTDYTVDADFTFVSLAYQQKMETEAKIQFTNTSPGNITTSSWNFGDGGTSNEFNPQYTYYVTGNYTVTLNVTDEKGCPGSVQKVLVIAQHVPCGLEFPNAFTPNNDGTNDNIGVLGFAETVELKIFNRWGEIVFRTFEIPKRWDGTYRNEASPIGAYPFILEWECPDESGRLRKYTRVGDVSLIR